MEAKTEHPLMLNGNIMATAWERYLVFSFLVVSAALLETLTRKWQARR
ncbi:MAG TPA: hypothetical protein O0X50_02810 [Methanocorpusculum sp.]|nr:hypothetical protein [Methanocorpusculum sp.]